MQADISGNQAKCMGQSYWQGFGSSIGVSAASMLVGFGVGSAISSLLPEAATVFSTKASSILWGSGAGALSGGITGGIISSATGGSFKEGFINGAIFGGISGGISGWIKYSEQLNLCYRVCQEMGIDINDRVSATDKFLIKFSQKSYPGAPFDLADVYTVENVPANTFSGEYEKAQGMTIRVTKTIGKDQFLTGRSLVYFNSKTAFVDARTLYFTIGHELMHVSQIGYLGELGTPLALVENKIFKRMMEFQAYSFRSQVGNSFQNEIAKFQKYFPDYYQNMMPFNFRWTSIADSINPYK